MFRRSKFAVVALLLAFSTAALAEDSNTRVMFLMGGSFVKGARTFSENGDNFRSEYASGGKAALRGTFDLGRHFAVEPSYSFGTNNLRLYELSQTPIVQRAFGIRMKQFGANVLTYANDSQSRLRFFGTFGVGLQRFTPTKEAKDAAALNFITDPATLSATNSIAFNFGGGVETPVSRQFGVRFDLRDNVGSLPRYGVPQTSSRNGAAFYPVSGRVQNIETTIGVVFYLSPKDSRY
jgi:hypothetical protein